MSSQDNGTASATQATNDTGAPATSLPASPATAPQATEQVVEPTVEPTVQLAPEVEAWRKEMGERWTAAIDYAFKKVIDPNDDFDKRTLGSSGKGKDKVPGANAYDCAVGVGRQLLYLLSRPADQEDIALQLEHLRTDPTAAKLMRFALWMVESYTFDWYVERSRFVHRNGPFEINRHNTHGELEGMLNRSPMRALFKRLVEQVYAFVAEAFPKEKIKIERDGKESSQLVLTRKPIRPQPKAGAKADTKAKRGKGKGQFEIPSFRDSPVIYIHEHNSLEQRGPVGDAQVQVLYDCADVYNMFVEGPGVAAGMEDLYNKLADLRKARAEERQARGKAKLGSKTGRKFGPKTGSKTGSNTGAQGGSAGKSGFGSKNSKGPAQSKSGFGSKSDKGPKYSKGSKGSKGGFTNKKNHNSRVTMSEGGSSADDSQSRPEHKPKNQVIIDGRPAIVKFRKVKETDKQGFQATVQRKVAIFQDKEGGEKVLGNEPKAKSKSKSPVKGDNKGKGKAAKTGKATKATKAKGKGKGKASAETPAEPEPEPEPYVPTGWAAIAAKPADPKVVAEAQRRVALQQAELKAKNEFVSFLTKTVGPAMDLEEAELDTLVQTVRKEGVPDIDLEDEEAIGDWVRMVLAPVVSIKTSADDKADEAKADEAEVAEADEAGAEAAEAE